MNSSYQEARRVALGLEREQASAESDDLWSISLGDSVSFRTEMPFQFFEKGFEAPDEQTAQKVALQVVYEEEYAADSAEAAKRLAELENALAEGSADRLRKLLEAVPLEEWLSLIFLDGAKLREELAPKIRGAEEDCRKLLGEALDSAKQKLVSFQDLFVALRTYCG